MKVAFDIHGTLDDDKDGLLKDILNGFLMSSDDDVFIISGPPEEQIKEELKALDIDYTYINIISVVDWLKAKGIEMWQDPKGDWWSNDDDWWATKGEICEKHCIGMIFDDLIQYKEHMPETTKFVLWQGYKFHKGE